MLIAAKLSHVAAEAAIVVPLAQSLKHGFERLDHLVLMLADGQIGTTLALLGCLLAGAGVAIVAAAGTVGGRPRSREPEMQIDRPGEISVRRQDGAGERKSNGDESLASHNASETCLRTDLEPFSTQQTCQPDEPESGEAEEPESSEPAQPEPERDPRLWSKPRGWISPPPGRRRATSRPSTT